MIRALRKLKQVFRIEKSRGGEDKRLTAGLKGKKTKKSRQEKNGKWRGFKYEQKAE